MADLKRKERKKNKTIKTLNRVDSPYPLITLCTALNMMIILN